MEGEEREASPVSGPKRFGQLKGPLVVWLGVTAYFAVVFALAGSSSRSLPQELTLAVALGLLTGIAASYGVVFVFLIVFVAVSERKRLRTVLGSLGFRKEGTARSLLWSLVLFPLYALVGLVFLMLAAGTSPSSGSSTIPPWYPYYLVLYSFFPVAVVEEAFGRGYLLDRLMPSHPCRLARATPAILLSSLFFTLYHLPPYLLLYSFSRSQAALLLALDVFPLSVLLAVAYVRSGTRNVAGPVFMHFLFDSLPYLLFTIA